jgi:SAM-dependent methyltransferase
MALSVAAERPRVWDDYLGRYRSGEWRAPIFRDMVLADVARVDGPARILDIGCGRGFDDDLDLQASIASHAGVYVGVEPDPAAALGPYFSEAHRCLFEDAPLAPGSIDVALAVMVLEHLPEPGRFWAKVAEVLREGGVFWGFTMDARHSFCRASAWMGRLRIKDLYLDLLNGRRGVDRYENYPVHYRANTPDQLAPYLRDFREWDLINFAKVGQLDSYLPGVLRPLAHALDRRALAVGRPGMVLAIRVAK